MNLFLIGYRGSGKSTVAPLIAKQLGWQTVDSDDLVELKSSQKIADIFERSGEDEFRRLETVAINELARKNKVVISLGGGAPMFSANRILLQEFGKVVYLQGSSNVLWNRISGDAISADRRPDLTDLGGQEEVKLLLEKRGPVYEACADYTIDIDVAPPEEIADRIVKWFQSDDKK